MKENKKKLEFVIIEEIASRYDSKQFKPAQVIDLAHQMTSESIAQSDLL